jgi:ligand-binding sensor domain-containing protein
MWIFLFAIHPYIPSDLTAQTPPSFLVRKVNLKGLPADTYFEGMVQDDDGFIWIGTLSGLYRYDGSRVTRFVRDPSDSNSLTHNYTNALAKDTSGNIWIGTFGGAMNRYDRVTSKIERIEPGVNDRLRQVIIRVKLSLNKEFMLVAASKCIFKISHSLSYIDSFPLPQTPQMMNSQFSDFVEYENDKFIIATTSGLFHLDWMADDTTRRGTTEGRNKSLREIPLPRGANKLLHCIEQDAEANFWIGSANDLLIMRKEGLSFLIKPHYDKSELLKGQSTNCIAKDSTGRMWIGTGSGLFVSGNRDKSMQKVGAGVNPDSISNINSLMIDRLGILWVGTQDNGLYQVYQPDIAFQTIRGLQSFLEKKAIRSILEEKPDVWLIGTLSGVYRYSFSTQEFFEEMALDKSHIWCLLNDRNNGLWVATTTGVFYKPFGQTKFTHFVHDPQNENSQPFNNIIALAEDEYGNIWMGVYNPGGNTEGLLLSPSHQNDNQGDWYVFWISFRQPNCAGSRT